DTALERVRQCLRWADLGRHLVEPWRVVIAGPPNAGKSTLTNTLAGFKRSLVAPLPGTTRDVVSTRLAIDGWPVELIDTAGLRADAAGLEAAGIDLARKQIESADLCLRVMDVTVPPEHQPPSPRPSPPSTGGEGENGERLAKSFAAKLLLV